MSPPFRDIELHNTKESASYESTASVRTGKMLSLEDARAEANEKRSAAARGARDSAVAATEAFVQREGEQRQELEGKIREVSSLRTEIAHLFIF